MNQLTAQKSNKMLIIIIGVVVVLVIAFIIVMNTLILPMGKYNDAITLMSEGKYSEALVLFESIVNYSDSKDKINECKYENALLLFYDGKYSEAESLFKSIENYKDSKDKISECENEIIKEKIVGSNVFLGSYEKKDIEWLVLDVKDGKVLVISQNAFDAKPYHTSSEATTWENCSLRKWLNNDFINTVFTVEEKTIINTVTVPADKNPKYSTTPGNPTQDKLFLLSTTEANKYFSSDSARQCKSTDYRALSNQDKYCWWWLRSPGSYQDLAEYVLSDGSIPEYGIFFECDFIAVRPAMWIDLDSELFK